MKRIWKRVRIETRESAYGEYKQYHVLGYIVITDVNEEIINHSAYYTIKGYPLGGDSSKIKTFRVRHYEYSGLKEKFMNYITNQQFETLESLYILKERASDAFEAYYKEVTDDGIDR